MPSLADAIHIIQTSPDVNTTIERIRDLYDLAHVTYHMVQNISAGVDSPWVRTTYPMDWVGTYVIRQFVDKDPVVRAGIERISPFDWSQLSQEPGYEEIFSTAETYGVGRCGFSVPIIDKKSRRALFSVNSRLPERDWAAMRARYAEEWIELAHSVHRKAVEEAYGTADPLPQLGPREIECLQWASAGKDAKETAMLLGLSEHTVRAYLKTARFKLDCANVSQAVTKAIRFRLI